MPYTPQTWTNDTAPPISAARLGVIETAMQTVTALAEAGYNLAADAGDQADIALAVASGGLPSYAPTGLTKRYDPATCSYGLTADLMAPQRLALGKARAGLGTFNWLNLGDSLSAQYFGSDVARPNDPAAAWPYVARDAILGAGVPWGGTGFVSPGQNLNAAQAGDDWDPRWTLTGSWNAHRYGLYADTTAVGDTATLTVPAIYGGCTDVAFIVDDQFADNTWVIKNSAGSTIDSGSITPAGTNTIRLIHRSGLTDARSITYTTPAGTSSGNKGRVYPTNIYKATGVQVHNLSFVAAVGTGSTGWENTGNVYNGVDKVALLCVPTPDLLTILLGGNDEFLGVGSTTVVSTGLTALFNKWGSAAGTKIFIGHTQAGSWDAAHMASWLGAYWGFCESNDFGYVDAHAFSGGYALMNAMGIVQDSSGGQTHPNQTWAQQFGTLMATILLQGYASQESIQDSVAAMLTQGSNITLTYDDTTGKLTVAASGGGSGWSGAVWAGSTAYTAGDVVQLPTGGLAYRTTSGTSAATWTPTERDAWTFIPGGHYEKLTATGAGSWKCPVGIPYARFRAIGAGGSGAGAASAATGIVQAGAGAGGAADPLMFEAAVVAGTSYTTAIAAASTGGTGGAAGGNLGTAGAAGGDTTIIIGGVTYTSKGGGGGNRSTVGNNTAASGGAYGFAAALGSSGTFYPGAGGYSGAAATGGVPLAGMIGGAGGVSATASLGGLGGGARTAPGAGVPAPTGQTATTSGGAGTTATEYGCGGGGGGGATGTTGVGGTGGNGAQGVIEAWF